jgi:hypothetical protein
MSRKIFGHISAGTEGQIDGEDGLGVINLGVTLYESGDHVPQQAIPLGKLIERHRVPGRDEIAIGGNGVIRLTMPIDELRSVPPDTPATLGVRWVPKATLRERCEVAKQ